MASLLGCWIFSIIFQLPYLQYNTTAERVSNGTVVFLATSTCLSSPGRFIMKFTPYTSISLDIIFITLVMFLNGFITDLLRRQRRKTKAASEHLEQAHSSRSCSHCSLFTLSAGSSMASLGLLLFQDSLNPTLRAASSEVSAECCPASITHPVPMSLCSATRKSGNTSLKPKM